MKLDEKCDQTSSHESHEGKHLAEEGFTKMSHTVRKSLQLNVTMKNDQWLHH